MGQKVGGYRRNVPYGQESLLLSTNSSSGKQSGWIFDVNPKGVVGWNRGTSGTKEREYGKELSEARRLRKELEEVRRSSGCESNGLGRKGTRQSGYFVYGEYTGGSNGLAHEKGDSVQGGLDKGSTSSTKRVRSTGKGGVERLSTNDLSVARERVARNYESQRKTKVERKRTNLKDRRKEKGLEGEKEERKSVLVGYSSKRVKGEERCEAIALSGVIPITKRRTNLIVRELESGLNHIEVLRNREGLRRHHAKSSQTGRKRLGEMERVSPRMKGGYYGLKVIVKGPLEGARRTIAYVIQLGTVPRGTKRARRRTTHEHGKTKIGTVGVRVTYCYGRG